VQIPTPAEVLDALRVRAIPLPEISRSPAVKGLTGLESRFWYEGPNSPGVSCSAQRCTVTVPLQLRGFSIEAVAIANQYAWSTGDGGSYVTGVPGSRSNPAVRHVYQQKSGLRSPYRLSLVMTWAGTYNWEGYGDSGGGTVGPVDVAGSTTYQVIEVRGVLE
jgi:hypothetical protein